MTVTATANKFRYLGNGVTDTFAYPARVYAETDLVIEILLRADDSLVETLSLGAGDYTVTIAANGTASVTVDSGKIPSNTEDILLYRDLPNEQTLSLPTGTVFPAKGVETALDRVVSQIQDLSEAVGRSVKIPITSSLSSLEIEDLPEAGKTLKWNATEDGLINSTYDPDEQATLAAASAATATTQAGLANTARIAAEAAETGAEAALADFETKYLGAFASDPTLDNEGNPLITGALYFNTVSDEMKVYDGANWQNVADGTDASNITFTPAGNIAATDVQAAIEELDSEKQPLDATLTALAGLATGANKIPYSTGTDTFGQLDFIDDDTMATATATNVPSAESVKAYVDTEISSIVVTTDPTTLLPLGDHFDTGFTALTASGFAGKSYYVVAGTAAQAVSYFDSPTDNYNGRVELSSGTQSSGFVIAQVGVNSVNATNGFTQSGVGAYTFKGKLQIPVLSTSVQRFYAGIGVADRGVSSVSASSASRFWYAFRYKDDVNSGNWVCESNNNGTVTTTNTSVAATTNNAAFEIRVNAANNSVTFYINGVLVATHTTNLVPSSQFVTPFCGISKTVGTTARTVISDYLYAVEA